MTLRERLKAARQTLRLKQDEMSAKSGVPLSSYQKYELGPSLPGAEAMEGFVRAGINANWLLTGEGPMLLEELQHQGGAELEAARAELAALQARMDKMLEELAPQLEVLRKVVLILEEELEDADIELTPESKAKVIVILYEHAVKVGALDTTMLRNVLSLAA